MDTIVDSGCWLDRARNYESEVDQILEILGKESPIGSVVEFGRRGGGHLARLVQAGLDVVGVDLDELPPDHSVDAAITLCSEIGYQVRNQRILDTLAALSRGLRPGGLILFDIIDGEAILTARLPARVLTREPRLLCGHTYDVNTDEQVYEPTLRMWRLDGDRVQDRVEETHRIRYFLPRELKLLLSIGGFELVGIAPLSGQRDPVTAWYRLAWARKA